MKKMVAITGCLLVLLVLTSCAGSGGTKSKDYRADLGVATDFDALDKTRRILMSRFHYEIVREEHSSGSFYFETRWKERPLFEDERELGVISARTRLIISTRPRARYGSGMAQSNSIRMLGESQFILEGGGEWIKIPMTDAARNYMKTIANEFKTEFKAGGLRKF